MNNKVISACDLSPALASVIKSSSPKKLILLSTKLDNNIIVASSIGFDDASTNNIIESGAAFRKDFRPSIVCCSLASSSITPMLALIADVTINKSVIGVFIGATPYQETF